MSIIFEKTVAGRRGARLSKSDVPPAEPIEARYSRSSALQLCELSELDVVRHFTELSRRNFGVDTNFYPLGSCTMKYNPKVFEKIAHLKGFFSLHPLLPQLRGAGLLTQGALAVIYELEKLLCEITGMDAFTLHPMAGAQGELTGMLIVAAYHKYKNNRKTEVLIPDEAHGTNPSSAATAGYHVREVATNRKTGFIDLQALESAMGEHTAALMLTNPNTLGIFVSNIEEIAKLAKKHDCLLYYDGANLNAVLGRFRPGDVFFDIVHVNLHKTFATPHGGGGPGAGPVGVRKNLERFLPISRVVKRDDNTYKLEYDYPDSIGYVAPFYGNFLVCLRAYAYILTLGAQGLRRVSDNAVLNANYILHSLKDLFHAPYPDGCMHECVLSAQKQTEREIRAIDIAKALIDEGFHPPTAYFPLIVKEALMIEPTETESKETLDAFIAAMRKIAEKAETNPAELRAAPRTTPVGRLDETKAAREMDIRY
ncbi:MAG: aminomethyl-transferring glycine dehydrogenase subunit GcvPB [Deltaproteobacteria bacterium]|nr:aminomethyl-transferring glycine dehydrogenase subunit GcvPB [Deltaproteobacteria bacterium]